MADKTVPDLTAAATLDGTELVHVVQGGNSRKTTTAAIAALGGGGGTTDPDASGLEGAGMMDRYFHGGVSNQGSQNFLAIGWPLSTAGTDATPTIDSTNRMAQSVRHERTSATAAGSNAGVLGNAANGPVDRAQPFEFEHRGGTRNFSADQRLAIGLKASPNSVPSGEPSALFNCILLACDSTDTNFQIMHNDGSGTCTKVDTGIAQAAGETYLLISGDGGGDVDVTFRFFAASNFGATPTGSFTVTLSSNLPATGTLIGPVSVSQVGPAAGYSISHCITRMRLRTPF